MEREPESPRRSLNEYVWRSFIAISLAIGLAAGIVLVCYAVNVFFVIFLGLLLAVFLRAISLWVAQRTFLSNSWALAVVVVTLVALGIIGGWFIAPRVSQQMIALAEELPKAAKQLEEQLRSYSWANRLFGQDIGIQNLLSQVPNAFSKAGLFVASTLGVIVNVVLVVVIGLYFSAAPHLYIGGLVRLLPARHRERGREVLLTIGSTLQRWIIGRLILMVTNGVITAIVLSIMGVPLAIPIGIITGLLNFVPNIGPIIAAIPPVLIAWVQSPALALYVVIFYVGYQMLDGYLLTPLVQKRTVLLPPALIIISQVLLGVLAGTMGVLLAVPLLAVVLVLIKMLYIEQVLEEPVRLPGRKDES